ncbi:phosphoribosyltransferase domain-containing protein [Clostridium sp. OS1-26]|uniref:phosphoribosyltransferase domain-containing protein n=1 Tax=Clostridium sp. OS1-26 TaxID=3070681 RepID=UPI0027DEFBCF|nr:phosphoribosyltransferase domain-containing protein [Clostridium sp. OS1-26]WML36888.1 phosphoribosyltransferase domain-containing protein [Clostridium sp. OS1-26]
MGKHLPVEPNQVDELGYLLSQAYKLKYKDYKKQNQMVIGFAETATALAHSFFSYLESANFFIHTTREKINNMKKIEFKEEHSHAIEQNLYSENLNVIDNIDTIILVDDEITTAKTCINIIEQFQKACNCNKYIIVSILNWISKKKKEEIDKKAKELNCEIEFIYLFNGNFKFELDEENQLEDKIESDFKNDGNIEINKINLDFEEYQGDKNYLKYTGRFGISRSDQKKLEKIISRERLKLKPKYDKEKILALGIEEFMYIPMMLSKGIKGQVYYQSITRSPIIPNEKDGYPIRKKYKLESFYNENINYIYNLSTNNYKECFLFMEIEKCEEKVDDFINILKSIGIKRINIVRC